jgi:hypothetical protein
VGVIATSTQTEEGGGGQSIFERLKASRPALPTSEQEIEHPPRGLDLLLGWLTTRWNADLITLRQVRAYGPGPVRDEKVALKLMQTLTERGWVTPVEAWRYDQRRWRVCRRCR